MNDATFSEYSGLRTSSTSGTSLGIPLHLVDPRDEAAEGGEGRNGSQGLGTRGDSDSCSPNIDNGVR